ncbi:Spy/CpxP family protein refolding chaperone [Massilia sp. IC2-476]|uniref:Spy/CpxP family protein refolding chaperone n=1 Tax=Massilia sp. IC2-476 TaxID=2887199 RepID=UPI001D11B6B4|nr:Spy/CpxP family protein refolding chaperone [Massilia sp. IC2-476]MCC2974994.1 Spy/CpxP family protein refolding chaperone [Massilia sp. IC2-476]
MNTVRKNIVIVLAAFGIAGASLGVQAQTGAPAEGRHGYAVSKEQREAKRAEFRNMTPEQRQAKMAEFRAKRLEQRAARQAKLAETLKLTPAQQPVWQAFVASSAPLQKGERAGQRLSKEQRAALTAPQRMERRIALQKARTARMEARLSALNSLYAALTPEQRKIFDEQAQHRRGGRHHGGHGQMMRG